MRSARIIINDYCYRKSTKYILGKCNWLSVNQMIDFSAVKTIHKILYNKNPVPLYNHYKINRRTTANIHYNYIPKSSSFRKYFIYHGISTYNMLPATLKCLHPRKFKKVYKKYLLDPRSVSHDRCVP